MFRDSSAPYALALIVSLIGWLFNSAIHTAEDLRLVEYAIEKNTAKKYVTAYLSNKSISGSVNKGLFRITCLDPVQKLPINCLKNLPNQNTKVQYMDSGSIQLPVNPEPLPGLVNGKMEEIGIAFDALIPPRAEVAFRFGIQNENLLFKIDYVLSTEDIGDNKDVYQIFLMGKSSSDISKNFKLSDRLIFFAISNYVSLLLILLAFVLLIFIIWFIISVLYLVRDKREKIKQDVEFLKVTINEESYVAKVETA